MASSVLCLPYKHEDLTTHAKIQVQWHRPVSPVLGRQRQEDVWLSIDSQINSLGKLQVPVRDPVSQTKVDYSRGTTWKVSPGFLVNKCSYTHVHTYVNTYIHMQNG